MPGRWYTAKTFSMEPFELTTFSVISESLMSFWRSSPN
jgi:hypothetical protein